MGVVSLYDNFGVISKGYEDTATEAIEKSTFCDHPTVGWRRHIARLKF